MLNLFKGFFLYSQKSLLDSIGTGCCLGSQHVACSMVGTTSDSANTWPDWTHLRVFPYSQKNLLDTT